MISGEHEPQRPKDCSYANQRKRSEEKAEGDVDVYESRPYWVTNSLVDPFPRKALEFLSPDSSLSDVISL